MKKGVVIFAHNSRLVNYALLSLIAGGLAKKNLGVPVSLITDESTVEWMKVSSIYDKAEDVFDKIIEIKRPSTHNQRLLVDTYSSKMVPFINGSRPNIWNVTPYDRTLLIDSDYLILSKTLNEFWDADSDLMMSTSMNDVRGDRIGVLDKFVSDTGIHLYWATTVMFTKNKETKLFFDLVEYIRLNYVFYSDLFRFNPSPYRNDIAFSIAYHIMNGFFHDIKGHLPPVLTAIGRDTIADVKENDLTLLINDELTEEKVVAAKIKNVDIHIMNKQSIIRYADKFLDLI
jgi:hypothetical protein